jgi:mRNA interferase RelE/StbE
VWKIVLSHDAAKSLLRMPRQQALRVRTKLDELARDPYGTPGVRKLTAHPGFRLRVGDWRVIYLLDRDRIVIQVIRIASRAEVYK